MIYSIEQKSVFIEAISRVLGHTSVFGTSTIYDHWEGDLRAPAEAIDMVLEEVSQNKDNGEAFVRNSLDEGEGVKRRPCRTRTCDFLRVKHS